MNAVRQILTGIGVGVVVALLVHQLFEHGLDIQRWSVRDAAIGRLIIIGAIVGAISQLVGGTGGRR
ncbi:hypothetical protein [Sphingomonas sp. RS2018]